MGFAGAGRSLSANDSAGVPIWRQSLLNECMGMVGIDGLWGRKDVERLVHEGDLMSATFCGRER